MTKSLFARLAIVCGLGAVFCVAAPLRSADHADILFIAIDDLNDWSSALGGHPQARTPNLDRLMARGLTFTNAHCAAPVCNPSRTALMSGLRPSQTGIYDNNDFAGPVLQEALTINRHLLAQGYDARGGGKIYHGFSSEGRDDTWTEWVGLFPTGGKSLHNANGLDRGHFDWGPLDIPSSEMGDAKLTDWAIGKLNEPREKPLFLAVGYVKPHLPWYVPQEYFDRFPLESIILPEVTESDLDDVPPAGIRFAKPEGDHAAVVAAGQWPVGVQAYLATISFLDDELGRLLDGLLASPKGAETVVVLWSDHGWHLGEKEHWRKFTLWEEATRTVFTVTAPGITQAGSQCAAPVDHMSVYPTLCDLAGLATPPRVAAPSLLPLLKNPAAAWANLALTTYGQGNHGVRDARYRYIRYADGSEELYDLETDPQEFANIANDPSLTEVKLRLATAMPSSELPAAQGKESGAKDKENGKGKGQEKGGSDAE